MTELEIKIEVLYERIREEKRKYVRLKNLFGEDHFIPKSMIPVISGMEKAFEIIAGHSATEHFLAKCNWR